MRTTYSYLAWAICALVAVQAAAIAWAFYGLFSYLEGGGTIDMEADGPPAFAGASGFMIHVMNGMYLIPLLALAMLGVAFATKVPGSVRWAAVVLVLVVVQVALGMFGHAMTGLGFLHGANALLLFAAALVAGLHVHRSRGVDAHLDARHAVPTA